MIMTTRNVFVLAVPTLVNYGEFSRRFNTKVFETEADFRDEFNDFVRYTGAAVEDVDEDEYEDVRDASGMTEHDFHYMRLHHFIERMNNGDADPFDSESDVDEYFYAYCTIKKLEDATD